MLSSGVPATLQQASSATNSSGTASTLVTLGSTVGVAIIQVTAGSASASFSLTVASTAASHSASLGEQSDRPSLARLSPRR